MLWWMHPPNWQLEGRTGIHFEFQKAKSPDKFNLSLSLLTQNKNKKSLKNWHFGINDDDTEEKWIFQKKIDLKNS